MITVLPRVEHPGLAFALAVALGVFSSRTHAEPAAAPATGVPSVHVTAGGPGGESSSEKESASSDANGEGDAQNRPTTSSEGPLSSYEQESLANALAVTGSVIDPSPEGKILEDVEIVTLEVIEERDPAPNLLNRLHVTTRTDVVRREVLLGVGEPYRQFLVDETVRSLRLYRQLSLVIAVPIRSKTSGKVRLLVITKDVWSLRAQTDIGLGAGGLDKLRFEPTERNLGGTLNSIFGRFELYPETLTFGGGAYIPRLQSRRVYFAADANVIVNRTSGLAEGTFGQALAWTPQVTSRQTWLWGVNSVWRNEIVRRYVNADVALFDAPSTPEVERIPDAYRSRRFTGGAQIGRSYGLIRKTDLTFGAEVNVREYVGLDPTKYDARVVEDHRRLRVPTSDTRAAPWVQVRVYENRFFRTYDLETLGLAEDFRLGYDVRARVYPVTKLVGSTRDFVGADVLGQYIVALGADGLSRVTGEALLEVTPTGSGPGDDPLPMAAYAANVAMYSPRFFLGRVVVDGLLIARPDNYLNQRSTLGGEGRLRGQPSAILLGANLLAFNAELRSRPLHILASQLGGALFFDAGDAFDAWPAQPKSTAGFGLRAVLPQLDRNVIRLDIGFPIVRTLGADPVGFYIAIEQAFSSKSPDAPNGLIIPTNAGALGQ